MNLTFRRRISPAAPIAVVARRTIPVRPMATSAHISPVARFISERVYPAPGHRLAIVLAWEAWTRFASAHGHDLGTRVELVKAIRRAYPDAQIAKGRSGKEVRAGKPHLTGLALR